MHACVYTRITPQCLGMTAQRARPPSARSGLHPAPAHPHHLSRDSHAAGPSARRFRPQAAHEGVTGRCRWKLAERCRALAAWACLGRLKEALRFRCGPGGGVAPVAPACRTLSAKPCLVSGSVRPPTPSAKYCREKADSGALGSAFSLLRRCGGCAAAAEGGGGSGGGGTAPKAGAWRPPAPPPAAAPAGAESHQGRGGGAPLPPAASTTRSRRGERAAPPPRGAEPVRGVTGAAAARGEAPIDGGVGVICPPMMPTPREAAGRCRGGVGPVRTRRGERGELGCCPEPAAATGAPLPLPPPSAPLQLPPLESRRPALAPRPGRLGGGAPVLCAPGRGELPAGAAAALRPLGPRPPRAPPLPRAPPVRASRAMGSACEGDGRGWGLGAGFLGWGGGWIWEGGGGLGGEGRARTCNLASKESMTSARGEPSAGRAGEAAQLSCLRNAVSVGGAAGSRLAKPGGLPKSTASSSCSTAC